MKIYITLSPLPDPFGKTEPSFVEIMDPDPILSWQEFRDKSLYNDDSLHGEEGFREFFIRNYPRRKFRSFSIIQNTTEVWRDKM